MIVTNRPPRLNRHPPKLTVSQFRMLQRIPYEGLTQVALLRQERGSRTRALRILRLLILRDLVAETRSESGEVQFELTDAGRGLSGPD